MSALAAARNWRDLAACRGADPDLFFPAPAPGTEAARRQAAQAITFCTGCPVRPECLDFAVSTRQDHGVWGGTAETERASVRSLTAGAA